jgi:DNA-binding CsgD family transcriptional regulator/tetratricopeptide (TPR) repeat protein
MNTAEILHRGRESFARRDWTEAFIQLTAADKAQPLEPEDLGALASAGYLIGRDAESDDAWARTHQEFLGRGEAERAVRAAFWLAFGLQNRGEHARASGWVARAQRILEGVASDCVERGYLLLPVAFQWLGQGDLVRAGSALNEAATIGARFADPDLTALACHSRGRVLIRMGEICDGIAMLDEAMAAVEVGEVSPVAVGDVYCSVIEGCMEVFDLRRAHAWTAALTRWCESQPDLMPFRGQCLIRRAEILQLHGAWEEALESAREACERLSNPPPGQRAAGAAYYRQGELHRLRGEFAEAEAAYLEASRRGRRPEPGLSQLRLAQGEARAAQTAIRRALEETQERGSRGRILAAFVEIMLSSGEVEAARTAAAELARLAEQFDSPMLRAIADQASGAVHLAAGDTTTALPVLRSACATWQDLEAPLEVACVRELIGLARRGLGDEDGAVMELDAARWAFQRLGAVHDFDRVEAQILKRVDHPPSGLTPRELQVLRLVATGKTNREIAAELFISERTVDRHVSNILVKLGLPTRSAATAYACEHELR